MKRMYVTLFLILLAMVWAVTGLTQKTSFEPKFDRQKRRMELREEMHKRMRDKLLHGVGPDQDLFQDMDQFMEEAMKESFSNFDQIAVESESYKHEWLESSSGRTLVITPQDDKQKLDIDVKPTLITIKGKTETVTNGSSMVSEFSNAFPVPGDCDGSKVKMNQKDGKILIELPFKTQTKSVTVPSTPVKPERKPIPHLDGEVAI